MDEDIDLGLDDLMDDGDVIETKLDLAKAYIEMGDTEGAKNLLDEVKAEGNEAQQSEANKLLDDM
jgi:Tfp pilus assembly protein FimV